MLNLCLKFTASVVNNLRKLSAANGINLVKFYQWKKTKLGRITSKIYRNDFINYQFVLMSKPYLLLISSSRVHGFGFLAYAAGDICNFLKKRNVSTVLFIPYAGVDHESYFNLVAPVFSNWGFKVEAIHHQNPIDAVKKAEAIFVGGGNTFLLLKTLYDKNLIPVIRQRVLEDGIPYMGSSAGTNISAPTIHNTNDMPIVFPPSFNALNLIPFNINPHFLDASSDSRHQGETREERILQYHQLPDGYPVYNVLGLREGCTLLVEGEVVRLKGINDARLYIRDKLPQEIKVGSDLSHLLKPKPTETRSTVQQ